MSSSTSSMGQFPSFILQEASPYLFPLKKQLAVSYREVKGKEKSKKEKKKVKEKKKNLRRATIN